MTEYSRRDFFSSLAAVALFGGASPHSALAQRRGIPSSELAVMRDMMPSDVRKLDAVLGLVMDMSGSIKRVGLNGNDEIAL